MENVTLDAVRGGSLRPEVCYARRTITIIALREGYSKKEIQIAISKTRQTINNIIKKEGMYNDLPPM
jgi:hypothetical protein